jgi:hypothetical protein
MLRERELRFMRHAAEEMRLMAKRAPEIADELREMSDQLHAKAWRNRPPHQSRKSNGYRSRRLRLPVADGGVLGIKDTAQAAD